VLKNGGTIERMLHDYLVKRGAGKCQCPAIQGKTALSFASA
jgi:hypothetical protein